MDQAQEINIKDIKVTHRSQGPKIDWAYLKKLHPAIHVIRALTLHLEEEFGTLAQGKSHTKPQSDADVGKVQNSYHNLGYHNDKEGRVITNKKDRAGDYSMDGVKKYNSGKVMTNWTESRGLEHSTQEVWESESSSDKPWAMVAVTVENCQEQVLRWWVSSWGTSLIRTMTVMTLAAIGVMKPQLQTRESMLTSRRQRHSMCTKRCWPGKWTRLTNSVFCVGLLWREG